MSGDFSSNKKKNFLKSFEDLPSLHDASNNLTIRCKFNFSYFDATQKAGQDFKDWTYKQLVDLLEKLKAFSGNSLTHWQSERVGRTGLTVLAIYERFPPTPKTDFKEPKRVIPHQVQWGRFRLGSKIRLVGFVIPPELHGKTHKNTGALFDKNTFYVVFLDRDHKFYNPKKK
jgi:hypothetical protein